MRHDPTDTPDGVSNQTAPSGSGPAVGALDPGPSSTLLDNPEFKASLNRLQQARRAANTPTHSPRTSPTRTTAPSTGNENKRPKIYPCNHCGKMFDRPSSLNVHMNSHTGDKPHICYFPGCDQRFSVLSNLRRHQRSRHNPDKNAYLAELSQGEVIEFLNQAAAEAGRPPIEPLKLAPPNAIPYPQPDRQKNLIALGLFSSDITDVRQADNRKRAARRTKNRVQKPIVKIHPLDAANDMARRRAEREALKNNKALPPPAPKMTVEQIKVHNIRRLGRRPSNPGAVDYPSLYEVPRGLGFPVFGPHTPGMPIQRPLVNLRYATHRPTPLLGDAPSSSTVPQNTAAVAGAGIRPPPTVVPHSYLPLQSQSQVHVQQQQQQQQRQQQQRQQQQHHPMSQKHPSTFSNIGPFSPQMFMSSAVSNMMMPTGPHSLIPPLLGPPPSPPIALPPQSSPYPSMDQLPYMSALGPTGTEHHHPPSMAGTTLQSSFSPYLTMGMDPRLFPAPPSPLGWPPPPSSPVAPYPPEMYTSGMIPMSIAGGVPVSNIHTHTNEVPAGYSPNIAVLPRSSPHDPQHQQQRHPHQGYDPRFFYPFALTPQAGLFPSGGAGMPGLMQMPPPHPSSTATSPIPQMAPRHPPAGNRAPRNRGPYDSPPPDGLPSPPG
ncbi:hypothetical protein H4R33_005708 [Dimargaris cristalligena]|nr:hypothetical protein H4R33_005708 [Dimargaris cristalligena]